MSRLAARRSPAARRPVPDRDGEHGQADTAGKSAAENLGTFPSDGAEHDATSPPGLARCEG